MKNIFCFCLVIFAWMDSAGFAKDASQKPEDKPQIIQLGNKCIPLKKRKKSKNVEKVEQVECPSVDFLTFFKKFANDSNLQQAFTRVPLESQYLDPSANPEPSPVTEKLSAGQIKFPIFESCKIRKENGLEVSLLSVNDKEAKVKVQKPDTDWLLYYLFEKSECWNLVKVESWSL